MLGGALLIVAFASFDRSKAEAHVKEQRQSIAARYDALEKKLKAIQAEGHDELPQASLLQESTSSQSLADLNGQLQQIRAKAAASLAAIRAKHKAHANPDKEEDALFDKLFAHEAKNFKEMKGQLSNLQTATSDRLKDLSSASSFVQSGAMSSAEARSAMAAHFAGLNTHIEALKERVEGEVRVISKRIIGEPSSMIQQKELKYAHHFEGLEHQLDELKLSTRQEVDRLTEDPRITAMNAGPASLLQELARARPGAVPTSLVQELSKDMPLVKRIGGELEANEKEYASKIKQLEAETQAGMSEVDKEVDDVPFPRMPTSFVQTVSDGDDTYHNYPKGHGEFEKVLQKLNALRTKTDHKIARLRETAGLSPESFAELSAPRGDFADLDARIDALKDSATASLKELKSSFVEEAPGDAESIADVERRTRAALEADLGDKDLFQRTPPTSLAETSHRHKHHSHHRHKHHKHKHESLLEKLEAPTDALLQKSEKAAAEHLEQEYSSAFQSGFKEGMAKAAPLPASLVESAPADAASDPAEFGELDHVEGELAKLKESIGSSYDKLALSVSPTAQLRQESM